MAYPTDSGNSYTTKNTGEVIEGSHVNDLQTEVTALKTKVGIDSSADTTSLDYLVKNTSSSNPGHKHTLATGATDVTATAAELNVLDGIPATLTATEIGYLDGVTSAIQTQLDGKVNDTGNETIDGVKTFTSDPIIPDEAYSSSWNGVLEPPTKNAVYDKIETIAATTYTNGTTTKNAADASTTQNIAHGLGKTPRKVRITAVCEAQGGAGDSIPALATTVYNGTTQSSQSFYSNSNSGFGSGGAVFDNTFTLNISGASGTQVGVVTFDGTNIIITWTKTNSPTGTYQLLWEAEA